MSRAQLELPSLQRGISLFELLLLLSILTILLVMAIRYFFVASQNDKINTTISQVSSLVAAAHNWRGARTSYHDISINELDNSGQLANFPGFHQTSKTLTTPWGGKIQLSEAPGHVTRVAANVNLPDSHTCNALWRAFPSSGSANIESKCTGNQFQYTFP